MNYAEAAVSVPIVPFQFPDDLKDFLIIYNFKDFGRVYLWRKTGTCLNIQIL